MEEKIAKLINEDIGIKKALIKEGVGPIAELAKAMLSTVKKGKKILIFGNGGSASDSIHMAAELVGRFRKERRPLPAIALTANIATITAISNDYEFGSIFERQIEALGEKDDMALGISTSGKSKNVIKGILKASGLGMKTAVLIGAHKGELSEAADICVSVPSEDTAKIQQAHITIAHIVCEIIEDAL